MEQKFDVVVIGAGAAGLMAAWEIARTGRTVAVVEARERIGGRAHTITDKDFELPVELGAEFVHGNLEPTLTLLKKAGIKYYEVKGEMWQNKGGRLQEQEEMIEDYKALNKKFKELKEDMSVADFIDRYFGEPQFEELRSGLCNYVEGYYAADVSKASTFALRDEWNNADEEQYRIEGGYIGLFEYIFSECKKEGVEFYFSGPVQEVEWKMDEVNVHTAKNVFHAQKIMITVPVGVLQEEKIRFSPAIPDVPEAARRLGYGPVIKTILQFSEPFWKNKQFTQQKNMDDMSFVFSQALVPTWWTYYPKPAAMLTGWSAGRHAREISGRTDEQILESALDSLSRIFDIQPAELRYLLKGWHVANWPNDPYSCGAYSFEVVNGNEAKQTLKKSIAQTIFFAGEGLFEGPEIGTVNAAFVIGRDIAHQLVASFKK